MKKKTKKKTVWAWVYSPPKAKINDEIKREVEEKAEKILAEWRKNHIKEPPKDHDFNYIVELYGKWHSRYFYFCAKYACPSPRAISPFFEAKLTRMEYVGNGRFNLAYMRYTGQWCEIEQELTLDEAIESIEKGIWYQPV